MTQTDRILNVAKRLIDDESFFVICVEQKGGGRFVVFVDGRKGITVDHCAKWNKALRKELEETDEAFAEANFELQVSSFGIGKPLMDERQYPININRKVKIRYTDEEQKTQRVDGILVATNERELTIKSMETEQSMNIHRKQIITTAVDILF